MANIAQVADVYGYAPLNDNPWLPDAALVDAQNFNQKNTPWWMNNINSPQQSMQLFAPGVNAAINVSSHRIPRGLSNQDMANMQARYAAQGQTQLRNNLGNMANMMGGAASPAFALSAARMKQGVGANTAGRMAQVRVDETHRNQDLQMQRRGQMIDAAKLGLGYGNSMSNWWQSQQGNALNAYRYNLDASKYNAWVRRTNADMRLHPGDTPWGGIP